MDGASGYGQHFGLQVLVLPVVPIRKVEFDKHLASLRQHGRIALADIPPPAGGTASVLSTLLPTPVSRGFLNLSFVTEWDASQTWLEEFQIHRKVHAVLGVLDCAEWQDESIGEGLQDGAKRFQDLVIQRGPADVAAKRCYAFNPGEGHKDNTEGLVVIPDVGDLGFYLGTLLAELASGILVGLSRTMVSLDSRSHIATPRERPGLPRAIAASAPRSSQDNRLSIPEQPAPAKSPHIIPGSGSDRSSSPLSASRPASMVAETVDAKAKKRLPGRQHKLRGDIYCLAGRVSEGLACYAEAINATKSANDFTWQAAATEASLIAQVYQSWAASQPLARNSVTHSRRPSLADLAKQPAETAMLHNPSLGKELPAQYTLIFELYSKYTPSRNSGSLGPDGQAQPPLATAVSDDSIHPLLLLEARMRQIRFQLAMLLSGAVWNQAVMSMIVGLNEAAWPDRDDMKLFQFALNSVVSKSDLLASTAAAHILAGSPAVTAPERTACLLDLQSVYASIHCFRRQAGIQRHLAALLASAATRQGKADTVSLAAPTGDIGEALAYPWHTAVNRPPLALEHKVCLELIEKACDAYGVAVVQSSEIVDRPLLKTVKQSEADMSMADLESSRYGWPELQLALVKDAIAVSHALSDYEGAIQYTLTALRELAEIMQSSDQLQYSQSIPRLFGAAARRGTSFQMAYWGPKDLVMSLEIGALQPERLPLKVPYSEIRKSQETHSAVDLSDRVYHSTAAKLPTASGKCVLVQGELAEFYVTLQNPFQFDLDIERIALITSGVYCQQMTLSSSVPPRSFHTIRLSCTPLAAGELVVKGYIIKVSGCAEREFLIPVSSESSERKEGKTRLTTKTRSGASRHTRFKAHAGDIDLQPLSADETFLTADVVPAQPSLRLRDSNLRHDSLVLYDGQRYTLRIVLENTSALDIDWLRLAFMDSHTDTIRSYLAEEDMSAIELYEIQQEATDKPVLLWRNSEDWRIPAHSSKTLEIICTGKQRLTTATVQIDYACTGGADQQAEDHFLSRRLSLPLQVTVNSALRCQGINLLKVDSNPVLEPVRHARSMSVTSIGKALAVDEELVGSLTAMDSATYCLLVVEVHNDSLKQTFQAELSTKDGSAGTIKAQIEPNATFNLLMPVKRLFLSPEEVSQPIPSLSNKQFVLGQDKTTVLEREMFWYRKALLSNLRLSWRELGTQTSGEAWIQDAEFTEIMLEVVKMDEYVLEAALIEDQSVIEPEKRDTWCAACESFYELKCSIRDRRARRRHLTASLAPQHSGPTHTLFDAQVTPLPSFGQSWSDDSMEIDFLSRQILLDGAKAVPLRPQDPGEADEALQVTFPLSFLSQGDFTLLLTIRDEIDNVVVTRSLHFDVQ